MTRPGLLIRLCVPGLVLLLILIAWILPGDLELEVFLVKENKPVLVLPLKPGELFTIHYYHSVENAPIWEVHYLDKKGNIFIQEERYEKFGAGMGKMPGVGRMVKEGIYEVIKEMHVPVGDFVLRVGSPGVNHTIIWRDRRFNLSEPLAHKAVQFSGKPRSMLYLLWRSIRGYNRTDPKITQ